MAGGGDTTSTVYQSNLPAYARPYYEAMMNRTLVESERDYEPYNGQRLTGMSGDTRTGLNMTRDFVGSDTGTAQQGEYYANRAAKTGRQLSNYNANGVNNTYDAGTYQNRGATNTYTGPQQGNYQAGNFNAERVGFGPGGVGTVRTSDFTGATANNYMSPYIDNVIQKAQDDAVQNFRDDRAYRDSRAVSAGAFGGSRAAVQEQMANSALQKNLTDIQTTGLQSAYENAQQQFERDRSARQLAQQANQQTGLQMGLANQSTGLEAQQMGEQSRQYGYGATEDAYRQAAQLGLSAQELSQAERQYGFSANQEAQQREAQMRMDAQRLTEELRQSGGQLRLSGGNLMGQQGQNLFGMQQGYDQMALDRIRAQLGIGQTGEEYGQQALDLAYNDFVNQRDAERQNLQFLSSILRGVPISPNQDVAQTTPTNPLAGVLGATTGLNALYRLGGSTPATNVNAPGG